MNAATSPVKALSAFSVAQFCAETLMFEPSRRSATLFSEVNTGAMMTSQWFALATRGLRASAVETESPTVLYIFQFPAMTALRISRFSKKISAFGLRLEAKVQTYSSTIAERLIDLRSVS